MEANATLDRRSLLKLAGGAAALGALGSLGLSRPAHAASNGFGLTITDQGVFDRMNYFRFATNQISWQPGVNVLLPDDYYETTTRRYPVYYLLHGGAQDFRKFDMEDDIRGLTAGRKLIVVMPDGGTAGWYSNPKTNFSGGPKNWETFHINQLIPWIDANFRTYAEYDGRAVGGFSMGGFGALKYTAKYYGHFASVSSHSGPASLRRDGGAVVHWANQSSKVDLYGGTIYGEPFWDQGRVTADNPVERINSYLNKRIFMVCGLDEDVNETFVRNGQREWRGILASRGIPHEWYELPGAHFVRRDMLQRDIDGVIGRLKKA